LADEFGPLALKTCRHQWVEEGLTRRGANRLTQTFRAIFKWGTENELVRVTTWQALTTVSVLKRGRTLAPDPDPVRPVSEDHLDRTLKAAHPMIQAMIRIQLKSGMRPGEVILLRSADIDTSRSVWVFTPLTTMHARPP
jgi:integrase